MANERKYETIGMTFRTEEDIYNYGTTGNEHSSDIPYNFSGNTIVELFENLKDWLGTTNEAAYIDEIYNNLCFTFKVDGDWQPVGEKEIEAWKQGKMRLWDATYTFKVIKTDRVKLEDSSELKTLCKG